MTLSENTMIPEFDTFEVTPVFSVTNKLGFWRILNFCLPSEFLNEEVDIESHYKIFKEEFGYIKNEIRAQPYKTTSPDLGFQVSINHGSLMALPTLRIENPFVIMIHSPFELPGEETQKFFLVELDYDVFVVTPQLNKIDDTMIDMEPEE